MTVCLLQVQWIMFVIYVIYISDP